MRNMQRRFATEPSDSSRLGRRTFLQSTGVSALSLGAGCVGGVGGGSDDQIRLGSLVAFPDDAPAGIAQQSASELAVEHINRDGGLLGEEVELVVKDTEMDPSTALARYRELVLDEGVDATVGLYSSEEGLAVADEVAEHETLHVYGGASTTLINDLITSDYSRYKYLFRTTFNGSDFGHNLVDLQEEMFEEWGFERVGVAVEDIDGFTEDIQPIATEGAPDFVDIAFVEPFSADVQDFTPILDRGESEDIDLLLAFVGQTAAQLTLQWAQRQPPYHFGGADTGSSDPERWNQTDGIIEGVFSYVGGAAPGVEPTQTTTEMIESHVEGFGGPPRHQQGYAQYDAIMSWANAVREAETFDTEELVPTLETDVQFEGTLGQIDFRDRDHEFAHDIKVGDEYARPPVMQWQEVDGEGAQVGLWPSDARSGDLVDPPWF